MSNKLPNASGRSNQNDKNLTQQKSQDFLKSTDKFSSDKEWMQISILKPQKIISISYH